MMMCVGSLFIFLSLSLSFSFGSRLDVERIASQKKGKIDSKKSERASERQREKKKAVRTFLGELWKCEHVIDFHGGKNEYERVSLRTIV
jgi:hypothetical protein